jgi:hypothetical protein
MSSALPGWVSSNTESLAREARPYVGLSPERRAELMASACRAAAAVAYSRPDAARVFAWRDPLPPSSVALLARLRETYRAQRDG